MTRPRRRSLGEHLCDAFGGQNPCAHLPAQRHLGESVCESIGLVFSLTQWLLGLDSEAVAVWYHLQCVFVPYPCCQQTEAHTFNLPKPMKPSMSMRNYEAK